MPEPDGSRGRDESETPGVAAVYIAALTDELAQLARRHGFDTLGFILAMAHLEADQLSKAAHHPGERA